MCASFGGVDLGYVQNEEAKVVATRFTLPETNTAEGAASAETENTFILTLMKPVRRISIQGIVEGTKASLGTWASSMEDKCGIDELSAPEYTYSGEVVGTVSKCLVESFRYTYTAGEVETIEYELTLIEGQQGS